MILKPIYKKNREGHLTPDLALQFAKNKSIMKLESVLRLTFRKAENIH